MFVPVGRTDIALTQAIKVNSDAEDADPNLSLDEVGPDGFPAFGVQPGARVAVPRADFLPDILYPQFSLAVTAKLRNPGGGYFFAVVDESKTVSVHFFIISIIV